MTFLTLEQMVALHVLATREMGGKPVLQDRERVEAAVATQSQMVLDEELYSTPFEKAAAIIRGLIADRPFATANAPTAMLAGLTLLAANGAIFRSARGELANFAGEIANEHLEIKTIARWLEGHC